MTLLVDHKGLLLALAVNFVFFVDLLRVCRDPCKWDYPMAMYTSVEHYDALTVKMVLPKFTKMICCRFMSRNFMQSLLSSLYTKFDISGRARIQCHVKLL